MREIEEAKMTMSDRNHASEAELRGQVEEEVHLWLKINKDNMIKHVLEIPSYESEQLKVGAEGARGRCFMIEQVQMFSLSGANQPP